MMAAAMPRTLIVRCSTRAAKSMGNSAPGLAKVAISAYRSETDDGQGATRFGVRGHAAFQTSHGTKNTAQMRPPDQDAALHFCNANNRGLQDSARSTGPGGVKTAFAAGISAGIAVAKAIRDERTDLFSSPETGRLGELVAASDSPRSQSRSRGRPAPSFAGNFSIRSDGSMR